MWPLRQRKEGEDNHDHLKDSGEEEEEEEEVTDKKKKKPEKK